MPYIHYYKNNSFPAENDLPFQWRTSFKKLINWWEGQAALEDSFQTFRAKEVLKRIKKIPQLSGSFNDVSVIEKHCKEINLLLSPFFPSLTSTNEIKAVNLPFSAMLFNLTRRFANLLEESEGENLISEINADLIYMFSCMSILNDYYKINISISPNLFFSVRNKKTSILNKYRALINFDFTEIIPLKEAKALTDKDIYELTNNFTNTQLWKEKIPPGSFRFEGFTIMTLFNVTYDESISALKFDLLKKDALTTPDIVAQIQASLSTMLNIPNLKTGFISYNKERDLLQTVGFGFWNCIVLSEKSDVRIDQIFGDNTKEDFFKKNAPFVYRNDNNMRDGNALAQRLSKTGLKSYIAVPLLFNNELIGLLEVGSELPNVLNTIIVYKLRETLSLFTIAMKRSQDEFNDQIDAIILQKFTAIHPSVAWRFTEEAEKVLEARINNEDYAMEEIIFPDVYPLYGESDIKGSSLIRNQAIQNDLLEQLLLAKNILNISVNKSTRHVHEDLHLRIENYIRELEQGLSVGDENVVSEFLKEEIFPMFKHMKDQGGEVLDAIENYEKQLDPVLRMIYKKRCTYQFRYCKADPGKP